MSDIPLFGTGAPNPGGVLPCWRAENIIGAFTSFADVTARNLIPATMLRAGEFCYLESTGVFYKWSGAAWVVFSAFGGGGSSIVDWKDSVRFATTTALAASTRVSNTRTANANGAFPTVDGVTAAVGNRFLDKNHATGADRGIWEIVSLGSGGTPWIIARTSDADTSAEVTSGMGMVVEEGTANGGKIFLLTTADPITLNTTSLTFTALNVGGSGGGGHGFNYTYDTTHVDADPGAGEFRTDTGTLGSAVSLWVSTTEYGGTDVADWLDQIDDYAGAIKGVIRLESRSDPTKWLEYTVTGWTTAVNYRKLTVVYKDGPAGIGTTPGDIFVSFDYATSIVGSSSIAVSAAGAVSVALTATLPLNNQSLTGAKSISYNGEPNNTGATPVIDFTTGDLQKLTLSTNCAPSLVAPLGIGWVEVHVIQGGAGGFTITWPGSVLGTPPAPAPGVGAHTLYQLRWDGTNYHYAGTDLSIYSLVDGTRAFTGGVTITQAAKTSGSPFAFKITGGAHTGLAASTEAPDVDLALNRTVQFATGAITAQRAVVVRAPTYGFVGASTISDAASLAITGAPIAGTNATITRRWALWVQGQDTRLDGNLQLGSGTYPSGASGTLRIPFGGTFKGTSADGTTQFTFVEWGLGGINNNIAFGDGANNSTLFYSGNTHAFFVGATQRFNITAAVTELRTETLRFGSTGGLVAPTICMADDVTNTTTGVTLTMHGQDCSGTTAVTAGAWDRRAGDATGGSGTRNGGHLYDRPGTGASSNGNWGWFVQSADSVNWQSMQGGIYCKNASVVPAGNPSGGGFLYVEAGALKYRGPTTGVSTIAPA